MVPDDRNRRQPGAGDDLTRCRDEGAVGPKEGRRTGSGRPKPPRGLDLGLDSRGSRTTNGRLDFCSGLSFFLDNEPGHRARQPSDLSDLSNDPDPACDESEPGERDNGECDCRERLVGHDLGVPILCEPPSRAGIEDIAGRQARLEAVACTPWLDPARRVGAHLFAVHRSSS